MIDTATYAKRLQERWGVSPEIAGMLAQQRYEIEEEMMTKADLAHLATKQDVFDLRSELSDLRGDIKVLKWGIGMVIAVVLLPFLKSVLPLLMSASAG